MAPSVLSRGGFLALALVAGLLALALSAPTQAGLLSTAGTVASCDPNPRQVFLPWGDTSYYVLVPGGSFEGTHGWSLRGGAKVVSGNEPFYVTNRSDRRSLYLPAGSSVTTPQICFDFADWHLRFFAASNGSRSSALEVDVMVRGLLGVVSVLDGGTVASGSTWAPSPKVSLLLTNLGALLTTNAISLRFTPVGTGAVQIDDVYLDPRKGV